MNRMLLMHLISCQSKLIFQKGNIDIHLLEKFKALEINLGGSVCNSDYKAAMTEVLKFTQKLHIENWIVDARDSDRFPIRLDNWHLNFYGTELPKTDVRKIARIASYHFHYETNISLLITSLIKKTNPPYSFQYKADTNEALEWFMENRTSGKIKG